MFALLFVALFSKYLANLRQLRLKLRLSFLHFKSKGENYV